MADIAVRTPTLDALIGKDHATGPATLHSVGNVARLVLRVRTEAGIKTAGEAFGLALPMAQGARVAGNGRVAMKLGPDEWVLLVRGADPDALFATIEAGMAGVPHSLVDISHRQVAVSVDGPAAARVLASACPLDLSLEAFPVNTATRTVFAKAEILLSRPAEDEFHVQVWRSFAPYVVGLLDEARREIGAV